MGKYWDIDNFYEVSSITLPLLISNLWGHGLGPNLKNIIGAIPDFTVLNVPIFQLLAEHRTRCNSDHMA